MKKNSGIITVFTPYEIEQCLYDTKRTLNFQRAIQEIVRRGDIVVDAGSGTGVLGLFAAQSGAKKVYCIETNPRFIPVIKINAAANRVTNLIEIVEADATTIVLPEEVDIIISELLSTGLFYEPFVQVIQNLRTYLSSDGTILPSRIVSRVCLLQAETCAYGLRFAQDIRYHRISGDTPLTESRKYDSLDMYTAERVTVDSSVIVRALRSGTANAIRITTTARLTPKVFLRSSKFLFNPMTIFLPDTYQIEKDEKYEINIVYKYAAEALSARIEVKKID